MADITWTVLERPERLWGDFPQIFKFPRPEVLPRIKWNLTVRNSIYFCRKCGHEVVKIEVNPNWSWTSSPTLCRDCGPGFWIPWLWTQQYTEIAPVEVLTHDFLLALDHPEWPQYRPPGEI